jgi:hypothetical protein
MTEATDSCDFRASIDRHFSGWIETGEEHRLRAHLAGCASCRSHYRRHMLLAQLDPSVPDVRTRIGRGLGIRKEYKLPRSMLAILVFASAAAATALLLVLPGGLYEPSRFFSRAQEPQAVRLIRYQVGSDLRLERMGPQLRRRERLAFAYQNQPGWKRLLVFAIDERKQIYWYHPAWTDPAARPEAIPILAGGELHQLGPGIAQELAPGRLRVFGVFTNRPVGVEEVERAVIDSPLEAGKLPLGDTAQVVEELHVAP